MSDIELVEQILRGAGISDKPWECDSDIHSWRCREHDRYPDICTCFQDLRDELVGQLSKARAEGERRVVEAMREFAELLVEQGGEHVTGCMGQADCAACVKADLDTVLAQFDGGEGV